MRGIGPGGGYEMPIAPRPDAYAQVSPPGFHVGDVAQPPAPVEGAMLRICRNLQNLRREFDSRKLSSTPAVSEGQEQTPMVISRNTFVIVHFFKGISHNISDNAFHFIIGFSFLLSFSVSLFLIFRMSSFLLYFISFFYIIAPCSFYFAPSF